MDSPDRIEIALVGALRPALMDEMGQRYVVHHIYKEPDRQKALAALGPRIRGVVGHGMSGLSAQEIDVLPNVEILAIHGVGLETTDMSACRRRNITVTTTPVLFDDVADLAIVLGLAVSRRIVEADRYVRSGAWLKARMPAARKFSGMRAGVLGLGRIGAEVARRLEGFKMQISYYDPAPRDVPYHLAGSAQKLAEESDILFVCAAGAPKGVGEPMVNRQMIDALGPNGILINVARGWLVDEPALVAALKEGRLGGAGLDVFYDEPTVPEELLKMDKVVLTPHVASATEETMQAMGQNVLDNLDSWFSGKGATTPVVNR